MQYCIHVYIYIYIYTYVLIYLCIGGPCVAVGPRGVELKTPNSTNHTLNSANSELITYYDRLGELHYDILHYDGIHRTCLMITYTHNPPTNIVPTNIARLELSEKFPMGLRIPPL